MLTRLDHLVILVSDLPASSARVSRLLGLRPSWRGEHPAQGTANTLFRLANTYVELLAPEGQGPLGRALAARLEQRGEGLVALAFGTDDAAACRRWLEARGLDPGPVEPGLGRDVESGAFRQWRRVGLPGSSTRGVPIFAIEHTTPPDLLPESTPAAEGSGAVFALDHVVIQTGDAEAARALYGEGLGLRLALDRRFEDWGVRLLFFRVGGLTVEVAARIGSAGAPLGHQPIVAESDRLFGLSWRVPDADAARDRLVAAGFDVSPVRKGRKPGTRVASVRGEPCGVPTLMIEPAPASPRA